MAYNTIGYIMLTAGIILFILGHLGSAKMPVPEKYSDNIFTSAWKIFSKLKILQISGVAFWVLVVLFIICSLILLVANMGGIDLAGSITNAIERSVTESEVAEKPEIRINLLDLYGVGQEFQYIKMPDARYKKIVLTETIRVRSTGTKYKYTDKIFAHFGAQKKGQARIKRIQNFGYVDFKHSYHSSIFMILPKGSIIEFGPLEDNTIWFSAGRHRVVLEPDSPGKPILFAYKEAP